MRITSFSPLIFIHDAQSEIELCEESGLTRRHTPALNASTGEDITSAHLIPEEV